MFSIKVPRGPLTYVRSDLEGGPFLLDQDLWVSEADYETYRGDIQALRENATPVDRLTTFTLVFDGYFVKKDPK